MHFLPIDSKEVPVQVSPALSIAADGLEISYRHAGPTGPSASTVVLLHGLPGSSFMYRDLIPHLADAGYRVIAPDLPGFGGTKAARGYVYTFANIARTFGAFVDALELHRFVLFVSGHSASIGFRFAICKPDSVAAIVTQNGNAYTEGFCRPFLERIEASRKSGEDMGQNSMRNSKKGKCGDGDSPSQHLTSRGTSFAKRTKEAEAEPNPSSPPPLHTAQPVDKLDNTDPARFSVHTKFEPVRDDKEQLAKLESFRGFSSRSQTLPEGLLCDYHTNVKLYPRFQEYLFHSAVPLLVIWGRNDTIFVRAGAEAYRRHVKDIELHWLEAGHFALEGNEPVVARMMRDFFDMYYVFLG